MTTHLYLINNIWLWKYIYHTTSPSWKSSTRAKAPRATSSTSGDIPVKTWTCRSLIQSPNISLFFVVTTASRQRLISIETCVVIRSTTDLVVCKVHVKWWLYTLDSLVRQPKMMTYNWGLYDVLAKRRSTEHALFFNLQPIYHGLAANEPGYGTRIAKSVFTSSPQ